VIYVPGGAGNKIEQQVREANAFYDNIGRWATENGMVGVLIQRHPGANWDDGGRDISLAVDWLHDNIAKYKGDPNRMVIWAHSAGNGPLGVYITHPDRWKNGVQVKAAIFMSGNPVPGAGGRGGRGPGGPGAGPAPGAGCGLPPTAMTSDEGKISGPSAFTAPPAGGRGPGGRGGQQLTPEQQAERDNLPGIKATRVRLMFACAELDPGVANATMPAASIALHDELCQLDGLGAKDGVGHCPAMLVSKDESHMSEVFSIGSPDKNVSGPVLAFVRKALK
jgi:triacylglycerol lipase